MNWPPLYHAEVPSIVLTQNLGIFVFHDWVQSFIYNPMRPACAMYARCLTKIYQGQMVTSADTTDFGSGTGWGASPDRTSWAWPDQPCVRGGATDRWCETTPRQELAHGSGRD